MCHIRTSKKREHEQDDVLRTSRDCRTRIGVRVWTAVLFPSSSVSADERRRVSWRSRNFCTVVVCGGAPRCSNRKRGREFFWKLFSGMPTDWITRTDTTLLSSPQIDLVERKVETRLGITEKVRGLDPKVWWPISRQIYADIAKNGKPERIDTFNGNYGLNRGLASACFALGCVAVVQAKWSIALGLLALTAVYDFRAYRFGVHYARELYLQFLVLGQTDSETTSSAKN
jgi:hypothetical protein